MTPHVIANDTVSLSKDGHLLIPRVVGEQPAMNQYEGMASTRLLIIQLCPAYLCKARRVWPLRLWDTLPPFIHLL